MLVIICLLFELYYYLSNFCGSNKEKDFFYYVLFSVFLIILKKDLIKIMCDFFMVLMKKIFEYEFYFFLFFVEFVFREWRCYRIFF